MRNLIAVAALLIGGFTQLPNTDDTKPTESAANVLVDDNPFSQFEFVSTPFETVQVPEPDPVPNQLGSPETDRLRELADQLTKDAAEIGRRADELKPALSSSYWETGPTTPAVCECKCDCQCLDEAAMRKIVSDEITAALIANPRLSSQPGSGSTGGAVKSGGSSGYSSGPLSSSSYTQSYSSQSWSPPVVSSGSAGGSVTSTASWPSSSTVQTTPNVRDRIASRLGTPLGDLSGTKVTIHKYASRRNCEPCNQWMRNVAPKLQADNCMVTEIYDLADTESAPQIDVCKDNTSCQRVIGAASYLQIVGMLR